MTEVASPFLRLPVEIRLEIYRHLLVPITTSTTKVGEALIAASFYHDYEKNSKRLDSNDSRTLQIRIIDPQKADSWSKTVLPSLQRTKCLIRTDRFRARTMQSTYTVTNNPGIEPAIMATCSLIHAEAAEVLYGSHAFAFDTHIEAIGAFLQDLTPIAKRFIRAVGLVKRALPYDRDVDTCEWDFATESLSHLPALRTLDLGVVAGKPGAVGWVDVPVWTKEDFVVMTRWRNWAGFEWVRQLLRVRVVEGGEVSVRAIVEHCPPPGSESMAFWVGLSRNIEGGFGEWIRELMLSA